MKIKTIGSKTVLVISAACLNALHKQLFEWGEARKRSLSRPLDNLKHSPDFAKLKALLEEQLGLVFDKALVVISCDARRPGGSERWFRWLSGHGFIPIRVDYLTTARQGTHSQWPAQWQFMPDSQHAAGMLGYVISEIACYEPGVIVVVDSTLQLVEPLLNAKQYYGVGRCVLAWFESGWDDNQLMLRDSVACQTFNAGEGDTYEGIEWYNLDPLHEPVFGVRHFSRTRKKPELLPEPVEGNWLTELAKDWG